jgi:putative endonuclease
MVPMEKKFYVYIIQSEVDRSIYIGMTKNLTHRIYEHNNGFSRFTKSKAPWKLIWYCAFDNEKNAILFEKYLKTGSGRAFIRKKIISRPP